MAPTAAVPPPSTAPSGRPIFIVGCPRSGTTMLQLMLHAHPEIAIPPESRFLVDIYDRREEFGDLRDPGNRERLANAIIRQRRRLRDLGLDPQELRQQIVDGSPTVGSAAAAVFQGYAKRFGKRRWGDKRPAYIQRLDTLLRLFPDAQIIHIIRDGRDCVSSLKRMPWWKGGVIAATSTWRRAMIAGGRARRRLPADTYVEVRYEDLIDDPEGQLRRLCAFLNEEFDAAMLEPHRVADVAVPERKVWHTQTRREVNDRARERWREDLGPQELRLLEFVAGRHLLAHGYELSGRRTRPRKRRLVKFFRYEARRSGRRLRRRAIDARIRLRYRNPVAAQTSAAETPTAPRPVHST